MAVATVTLAAHGISTAEASVRDPSQVTGLADGGQAFHDDDDDDDDKDGDAKKIKIQGMVLRYHDFGLGTPVTVQLVRDTRKSQIVGSATVANDGTITVRATSGQTRIGSSTHLSLNGTVIQIHTSCSKPIDIGFFYGPDGDDTHEAESHSAFALTGLNAALEVIQLDPLGACGSFVATPTPTPSPTATPTPAPTATPTPAPTATPTPPPGATPTSTPPSQVLAASASPTGDPAALPATGGDQEISAGGPGYVAIPLALAGLSLIGGGAWAIATSRQRKRLS